MKNSTFCKLIIASLALLFIPQSEAENTAESKISQTEAIQRAQQVSDIEYKNRLSFDKKNDFFSGFSDISFSIASKNLKNIWLDLHQAQITEFLINGKKRTPQYNQSRIQLEENALKEGRNQVQIRYTRKYVGDGNGLHRFVDVDKEVYLYTQFEPNYANRVFPSFDQPDLKAKFKLTVEAPKDWVVISQSLESSSILSKKNKSIKEWEFPQSPLLSTYVFPIIAGPYKKVASDKAGMIPIRLFARRSLASFTPAKLWMSITKQGLEFFPKTFGHPYPFSKYDQVLVPEFNWGGMENVAAVTFSERFAIRGTRQRSDDIDLANIILHEMAHMWFGDLVTMKWWNDLWLNESFATFFANYALSSMKEFDANESWIDFHGVKSWAYSEDDLITTHPIEARIQDTQEAFANFDGITYGKGAAVLKQLHYFIGDEAFKKGLGYYFQTHAWKNTELKDFIAALEEASNKNLQKFRELWLQSSGLSKITSDWKCSENKLKKITLIETPKNAPFIRSQKTQIGFFKESNGQFELIHKEAVEIGKSKKTAVNLSTEIDCPDYVDINFEDFGYYQSVLDEKSLQNFQKNPLLIQDTLARLLAWESVWNKFYNAELSKEAFYTIIEKGLQSETNYQILQSIIAYAFGFRSGFPSLYTYWPHITENEKKTFDEKMSALERIMHSRLLDKETPIEIRKSFFKYLHRSVIAKESKQLLKNILDKKVKIKDIDVGQDQRWTLIFALGCFDDSSTEKRVLQELKRDKTSDARVQALTTRSCMNISQNKKYPIDEAFNEKSKLSLHELRAAWAEMYPPYQEKERSAFADDFFKNLEKLMQNKDSEFLESYAALAPLACTENEQEKYQAFLKKEDIPAGLKKELKATKDRGERCLKIRSI